MRFERLNNIVGWAVFGFSFLVYLLTVSPTASFWDTGEFIACANELQVPHPPGAPLFLLISRLFIMVGGIFSSSPENPAYMMNLLSALSTAFMVLFTFWTITMLARKSIVGRIDAEAATTGPNATQGGSPARKGLPDPLPWDLGTQISILFAGVVGALAAGFASSNWFNAVEAEVYALSSFFTALIVWLMFKWEARADSPSSNRWLLVIAYLVGLSFGVHLLGLLTLPALAMIYYFRKYSFSWGGLIGALAISGLLVRFAQVGIGEYTFDIAWWFERHFTGYINLEDNTVSGFGLSPGTGTIVWFVLLFAGMLAGLVYSHRTGRVNLSTGLLAVIFVYVGISTYALIPIRAAVGPPINENAPDDLQAFLYYMKREQYGSAPLLYGDLFNAYPDPTSKVDGDGLYYKFDAPPALKEFGAQGDTLRRRGVDSSMFKNRYVLYGHKPEYERLQYGQKMFFPRMHAQDKYAFGADAYTEVIPAPPNGQPRPIYKGAYIHYVKEANRGNLQYPYDDKVTMGDNLKFFFNYQVGWMYLRYFGWNFVGRQGDVQESDMESGILGGPNLGNVPPRLEQYVEEAEEIAAQDPSRNHYYALPLLLGLLGMVWHFYRNRNDAMTVGMLFLFTGFMIVVFLNQPPQQPRERDYSYAGSFTTFAFWIGLGVLAVYELVRQYIKRGTARVQALTSGAVLLGLVPMIMLAENFHDHSRAGRFVAPDSARNLLESCGKNAILFTNGDNDTFPLWYLQEVEGVRTDVRIINLSLLNTHWYIHELKKPANEAPPVPLSLPESFYMGERHQVMYRQEFPAQSIVNDRLRIPLALDKDKLVKNGMLTPEDTVGLPPVMTWDIAFRGGRGTQYLLRQDLMIIDMMREIAKNGWDRPLYFAITIPSQSYLNLLPDYFQQVGMAFKVVPKKQDVLQGLRTALDRDAMYTNLMEKYWYRNLGPESNVYLDANIKRMVGNFRNNFVALMRTYMDDAAKLEAQAAILEKRENAADPGVQDSIATFKKDAKDYRERALKLARKMESSISDHVAPTPGFINVRLAEVYAELADAGQPTKADAARTLEAARKDARYGLVQQYNGIAWDEGQTIAQQQNFDVYTLQQVMLVYSNNLKDYANAAAVANELFQFTDQPYFQQEEQRLRQLAVPKQRQPDSGEVKKPSNPSDSANGEAGNAEKADPGAVDIFGQD